MRRLEIGCGKRSAQAVRSDHLVHPIEPLEMIFVESARFRRLSGGEDARFTPGKDGISGASARQATASVLARGPSAIVDLLRKTAMGNQSEHGGSLRPVFHAERHRVVEGFSSTAPSTSDKRPTAKGADAGGDRFGPMRRAMIELVTGLNHPIKVDLPSSERADRIYR